MRLKLVALISVFGMVLSVLLTPVKADPYNGGFAIGIVGNISTWNTSGTETEGNTANINQATETASASVSENVDFASLLVEYNMRGDWLGLGFGLEWVPGAAELGSKSRTDTDIDENGTRSVTYTAKAEVENLITAHFEPTIYFGNNFGLYVKASASTVTVNSLETITGGINSSVYPDLSLFAASYGAGIRLISPWGLMAKLEYVETDFNTLTFQSDDGNRNKVVADIDNEIARIVIGWQF